MSRFGSRARALGLVSAVLLLFGCATTTLDGTWTRPAFEGQPLRGPVLVVGVAHDATVRRIYEDEMAAHLRARGIVAQTSYERVPGTLSEDSVGRLQQAARDAGATHLLSTAVIGREIETVVHQDPWVYGGWGGYRGWYGSYWSMAYPAHTEVRSYDIYIAQTSLTEIATDRIDWTARTRTTEPTDIAKEMRAFVDVIIDALDEDGVIPPLAD